MISKQLLLPLDYTASDEKWVQKMTNDALDCGDFANWDHAYESLWNLFERQVEEDIQAFEALERGSRDTYGDGR